MFLSKTAFPLPALLLSVISFSGNAQRWTPPAAARFPFVKAAADTITGASRLGPLWKKRGKTVIRIVHIGDSHTQADMMTGVVRKGLQRQFGNAGRGLVFPYQVAGSNAPADIVSSSDIKWTANRLAHPEMKVECGISGFGIHSSVPAASFMLGVRRDSTDNSFQRVHLFTNKGSAEKILDCVQVQPRGEDFTFLTTDSFGDYRVASFSGPVRQIEVKSCARSLSFYGASLEKAMDTGLLYHSIGVNGAQYSQYNSTPLFWKQLPQLQAHCYVVSLGTNEAQRTTLDRAAFRAHVLTTVQKLRAASPGAVILLTTPAGSHTRSGKPNAVLGAVSEVIREVCRQEGLPCWDLYGITGGYRAAPDWKRSGLMARDGIHYNAAGYRLQGQLFLEALAASYNASGTSK
jgi:hypothetical protein